MRLRTVTFGDGDDDDDDHGNDDDGDDDDDDDDDEDDDDNKTAVVPVIRDTCISHIKNWKTFYIEFSIGVLRLGIVLGKRTVKLN